MKAYLEPWFRAIEGGRLIESDNRLAEVVNRESGRIQTVNLQHLHLAKHSSAALQTIEQADYVTADGWPLVKAAREAGHRSCQRVTGKSLCQSVIQGSLTTKFALLGTDPLACKQFSAMARSNGSTKVMCVHGLSEQWNVRELLDELERSSPRLVLVALGAEEGEILAANLTRSLPNSIVVVVGGGVEMATGMMPSAPLLVERYNLEWMYRLAKQPRRMARRYLLECPPVAWDLLTTANRLKDNGRR